MDFALDILKLIGSLIILFALMVAVLKFSKKGIDNTTRRNYTKIIDKTQISKDSFIIVMKLGKEGMVLLTSSGHTEKLKDLSEEEVIEIEENKIQALNEMTKVYDKFLELSKDKMQDVLGKIKLKEDKHEK